jgi:hypothetical protein
MNIFELIPNRKPGGPYVQFVVSNKSGLGIAHSYSLHIDAFSNISHAFKASHDQFNEFGPTEFNSEQLLLLKKNLEAASRKVHIQNIELTKLYRDVLAVVTNCIESHLPFSYFGV